MTKKEKRILLIDLCRRLPFNYKHLDLLKYNNDGFEMANFHSIAWLNSHQFDYKIDYERGNEKLIPLPSKCYKAFSV